MPIIFFILSLITTLELSAKEITNTDFPLILPISVENPPVALEKNLSPKLIQEKDDDNDGVINRDDKCPQTQVGMKVDLNGCRLDTDNDGIFDDKDECPDTKTNFIVDEKGCPQVIALEVHFTKASYKISSTYKKAIKKFASFLKENQDYQVIIYGFTADNEGSANNKELSQKRANTVMDSLIKYGIRLTKLTAIGMGTKNPIADNTTTDGQAKNRRIEVELLK